MSDETHITQNADGSQHVDQFGNVQGSVNIVHHHYYADGRERDSTPRKPGPAVFICYASGDGTYYAERLESDLSKHGYNTWRDYRNLVKGEDWQQAINAAIDDCDALVVVLTPRAMESRYVRQEYRYALERGKRVLPLWLPGFHKDDALADLARLQWIVADTTEKYPQAFGELCAALPPILPEVVPPRTEPGRGGSRAVPTETPPAPEKPAAPPVIRRAPTIPVPEMVRIPAGTFLMGSVPERDPNAKENEIPQITVDLPQYWIGKYPVTVGEYRAFVQGGGYDERRWWIEAGWEVRQKENWTAPRFWDDEQWTGDDRLPVIGVSWYEAWAYAQWLAEMTGDAYLLPTEAEWEKAARGTDGRIYPWGDKFDKAKCNTDESGIKHTTPVGQYSPQGDSPYGCADMAGNVWEWCLTKWGWQYAVGLEAMDNAPAGDASRVVRGGSCLYNSVAARAVARVDRFPYNWFDVYGFRVVVAAPM